MNVFLSTHFQTEQLSKIHPEQGGKGDLSLFPFKKTSLMTLCMQITCKGGLTCLTNPFPGSSQLVAQRPTWCF